MDRTIGDHLVGVHVGLRARTGLEDNQRKFVIPSAVDHFLCGTNDQIDFFFGKLAQFAVGQGGTFLQNAESSNDRAAPPKALNANWKIPMRALRLRTPQVLGWNLDVS